MTRFLGCFIFCCPVSLSYAASIHVLEKCNASLNHLSAYTVLDIGRNTLGGWSHIDKGLHSNEFSTLSLDDSDYQITQKHYVIDKSCEGQKVQNANLVVKLSNWERQHSNGLETLIDDDGITFGDVSHVLMDIRINSAKTKIASHAALTARYGEYLDANQFSKLDRSKVNLGIMLFEQGALDQSTESFNLEFIVEIDQSLYGDRWLRVLIPLAEFEAYSEKEYRSTGRSLNQFLSTGVSGFRINPETTAGKQLRNVLGDAWTKDIPETFKDMSISLRRIELLSPK